MGRAYRDVMSEELDCVLEANEFVPSLCYYFHFRSNVPWERHEHYYPPVLR